MHGARGKPLAVGFLGVELGHLVTGPTEQAFSSASLAPLSAAIVADALRKPWPE
ncbi:hypothetical protein [Bradyrhizobium sp.]|uniref:hypothetical protein n=1 Tax=Bradyrhizobium sp. TaxID=376 RepID=UPI00260BE6CD|nr:hypothetical protein [Bradyrhizobium sp.]